MAGERVETFVQSYGRLEQEVHKVIVGHDEIVDQVLVALFAGGHVLLEGVRAWGRPSSSAPWRGVSTCPSRDPVHAGPDAGRHHRHEHHRRGCGRTAALPVRAGPVFAHILLADEVNRATPKTSRRSSNWKCRRPSASSTMMFVPMMSAGIRSGVNWIRENERSRHPGQGPDEKGLPEPGTYQEDMPAREERDEYLVHDLVVSDDDLVDLTFEPPVTPDERFYAFTGHALPLWSMESVRAPETWTHYRPAGENGRPVCTARARRVARGRDERRVRRADSPGGAASRLDQDARVDHRGAGSEGSDDQPGSGRGRRAVTRGPRPAPRRARAATRAARSAGRVAPVAMEQCVEASSGP